MFSSELIRMLDLYLELSDAECSDPCGKRASPVGKQQRLCCLRPVLHPPLLEEPSGRAMASEPLQERV